jgi:hypothetical protein
MMQSASKKTISGDWRIVWMELWDQEYVDLVEPSYIRISHGRGEFQFGTVTGSFHTDSNSTYVDSTWEGSQECDEACGEIYGTLNEEGKEGDLCGTIDFWEGDQSEYRAVRVGCIPVSND